MLSDADSFGIKGVYLPAVCAPPGFSYRIITSKRAPSCSCTACKAIEQVSRVWELSWQTLERASGRGAVAAPGIPGIALASQSPCQALLTRDSCSSPRVAADQAVLLFRFPWVRALRRLKRHRAAGFGCFSPMRCHALLQGGSGLSISPPPCCGPVHRPGLRCCRWTGLVMFLCAEASMIISHFFKICKGTVPSNAYCSLCPQHRGASATSRLAASHGVTGKQARKCCRLYSAEAVLMLGLPATAALGHPCGKDAVGERFCSRTGVLCTLQHLSSILLPGVLQRGPS